MAIEDNLRPIERSFDEKTPSDLRQDFRLAWSNYYKGDFPVPDEGQRVKEATVDVEVYEVLFDPTNTGERKHYVQEFGLKAVSAGFEIVQAISVPSVSFTPENKSLTSITYLLKSPTEDHFLKH